MSHIKKEEFVNLSALELANKIRDDKWSAKYVMSLTLTLAKEAHDRTNSITQIFPETALAEAEHLDERLSRGEEFLQQSFPFLGIPIPIKDVLDLKGRPTVAGYKERLDAIATNDAHIVEGLRNLGCIPFCKTNVPQFTLFIETSNPLYGTTTNPYNPEFTAGGSSGGDSALLAADGCHLAMGSDICGSLRGPASYCGVYTFKPSPGRLPMIGHLPGLSGQEAIPGVVGPFGRNVEDMNAFFKGLCLQEFWNKDITVLPISYKPVELGDKKLRIGYFVSDGQFPASPANERAAMEAVNRLERAGHECFPFAFPEADKIYHLEMKLLYADGMDNLFRFTGRNEPLDWLTYPFVKMLQIPNFVKSNVSWALKKILGQKYLAEHLQIGVSPTVGELWRLQAEKQRIMTLAQQAWVKMEVNGKPMDAIICPNTSLPGHKVNRFWRVIPTTWFMMLFNIIGYSTGTIPVTKVDSEKDRMTGGLVKWIQSKVTKGTGSWMQYLAYNEYDADAMKGLPVGIQVVCKRFEDEKCLEVMRIIDGVVNSE